MQQFGTLRFTLALGAALSALSAAQAATPPKVNFPADVIPPRLSVAGAQHLASNPAALASLTAQLARYRTTPVDNPAATRRLSTAGGSWTLVHNVGAFLTSPVLLTDGTVIASSATTPVWFRLTPDQNGSYANGTWAQIANMPVVNGTQYAPLYHATGVLPDGRVAMIGGEYNKGHADWTNLGAVLDPVANAWTPLNAPRGTLWGQIGDAQSVVLANGTFMLAACCSYLPPADALLDAKTLTWAETGAPRFGGSYQDEQGYELLPDGSVLTLDIWTNVTKQLPATNAERYFPGPGVWRPAGNTPVSLPDPIPCGNYEIGPAPLRQDGTVVAFGGNTGCVTGATTDPTAIYNYRNNSWVAGPTIPSICGSDGATACSLADAPAAVLPDGNILFAASSGYGAAPTHFFEMGTDNSITQVADPLKNSAGQGAYTYDFLVLPSGEILMTDFSPRAEIYTPAGTPNAKAAPAIISAPTAVTAGKTYNLVGRQLGGLTAGAYYGDDAQMATNFPVVRITNTTTHHVFYARSFGWTGVSVTPGVLGSTNFTVPAGIESGASELQVVASGVASAPVIVTVAAAGG